MHTPKKYFLTFLVTLMLGLVGVTGCEEKGPMEEAGETIDEAGEDAKRGVEDATD